MSKHTRGPWRFSPEHRLRLPLHLVEGLEKYFGRKIRTGGFLQAVLENNLAEAISRADPISLRALPDLIAAILDEAPDRSHGSRAAVAAWIQEGQTEDHRGDD